MNKFKIGDIVRIINTHDVGVVISLNPLKVKYPYDNDHSHIRFFDGTDFYIYNASLELIEKPPDEKV